MNRSLLLVVCDFLLLSILALARFDVPEGAIMAKDDQKVVSKEVIERISDGENYDIEGRYRVDDYELDRQVQKSVSDAWGNISDESLALLADFDEYKRSFLRLFGFEIAGIDYSRDVDPEKVIPGIINL